MRRGSSRRLYFYLAEKLGYTVGELLQSISSSELTEWIAELNIRETERKRSEQQARVEHQAQAARNRMGNF